MNLAASFFRGSFFVFRFLFVSYFLSDFAHLQVGKL